MSDNDSPEDDRHLVSRVVARQDSRAFGELVRRHQSQIRNFLRKLCRDPELADDLSQDCFLHAWNKMHTYAGKGSVIGWLLKIAYTTFLQSRRKSKRYGDVLQAMVRDEEARDARATVDSPEIGDLDRFLAVLDEQERAVMIMSYACGLSHREIGEATAMPVGTVKSIIFRGKEKIRQRFDIQRSQHG